MKFDFSGYATKAGLKCSDGRTIMPDAFKHQDKMRVPLVWQHGHTDPENVLGHVILENRNDGVYAYGFFNNSVKGGHARELIQHKDINALSIWANDLIQRSGKVLHGAIREVSLVLSGANPGALIENVTIHHGDGGDETLDDEVIIYTGLELELEHASDSTEDNDNDNENDPTIQEVYDSMNDQQKGVLSHMVGQALSHAAGGKTDDSDDDETIQDVYDSMSDKQKDVLHYMLGQALENAGKVEQSGMNDNAEVIQEAAEMMKDAAQIIKSVTLSHKNQEGNDMHRNVFEKGETGAEPTLSHADMLGIVADATKNGSLKDAVEGYALSHGIENIDVMFPDAQAISGMPEVLKRQNEWVAKFLGSARKSPFTRVKSLWADLTLEQARAKGYVKGSLKKEQFFPVAKRVTIPSTIYKKQKLDRDDMIDITDFDVVVWLKGEMRYMLDEELARAILISDGREIGDEDKINEDNIRPISKDHELYTTKVTVNVGDAASSSQEVIDAIIMNRRHFRGTGIPCMYTTETWISNFLMIKDTTGRRIYRTLAELASELRVSDIVSVDVMEEEPTIIAVLVNPVDYVIGADKGGQVSLFDDFDIDYNQYKYLIETRVSGALVKLKSAIVIQSTTGTNVLAAPAAPTFDEETGALTIVNTTGVVYKHGVTVVNAAGSPYTVDPGTTWIIDATPASGYYFASSNDDQWTFTADEA